MYHAFRPICGSRSPYNPNADTGQVLAHVAHPLRGPLPVQSLQTGCRHSASKPSRALPASQRGDGRGRSSPIRSAEECPAGIRIEALAVRARRSCSSRSDLTPWRSLGGARPPCATPRPPPDASVAACAARSRPNGSATFSQPASRPHYFVALKQAKSPCRARQSTQAYPLARSASKCRATERRPGSWSLKTSGAATKSALRNRPPTDSNS